MIYKIKNIRFAGVMQLLEAEESILTREDDTRYTAILNRESKDVMILPTNKDVKIRVMTSLAAIRSYTIDEQYKYQDWNKLIEAAFLGRPHTYETDSTKRDEAKDKEKTAKEGKSKTKNS